MDTGLNEGYLNAIAVQEESTFAGSVTGTARHLPGKVNFQYQPILEGVLPSVNIWRQMDGESFATRHYRGSFELEYAHGETVALILASLMKRSGTSPNYTFRQFHFSDRKTLAIGLSYLPNNQHLVFRGVVIEAATFAIRARELVKVKFDFKAAKMTQDGPLSSPVTETRVAATGTQAGGSFDGVGLTRAYDASLQITDKVTLLNFNDAGIPTSYEPAGTPTISVEFAEWMANDSSGDQFAVRVRELTETDASVLLTPAPGKVFQMDLDRVLARSGTPVGIDRSGIGYRAGVEAQSSENRADVPVLTMTI